MADRRPTRDERREQARRERAKIQREMAAQQRSRRIITGVAVIAGVALIAWYLTRPVGSSGDLAQTLADGPAAAEAAGCTEVVDVGPYQPSSQDGEHVAVLPALTTYPSIPPASGPHSPDTMPAGIYEEAMDLAPAIHSLEHGGVIVFYDPDIAPEKIAALEEFYGGSSAGADVLVSPYDYPDQGEAGALPDGTEMALVAWHFVQTCASADPTAAFNFSARYAYPSYGNEEYLGIAPEAGAPM